MQKRSTTEDKHAGSWGSGVLGARMEMHSSLITSFSLLFLYFASFLYSLKPYFFSILRSLSSFLGRLGP
jgi:hypothetical protein